MNQQEIKIILEDHAKWIKNPADGKRAKLEGTDLIGLNFEGANLQWAILIGVNMTDANLHKANLRGADLSGALFKNANLRQANFDKAILQDTTFEEADLNGASFRGAKMNSPSYRKVMSNKQANLKGVKFVYTSEPAVSNPWGLTIKKEELKEILDRHTQTLQDLEDGASAANVVSNLIKDIFMNPAFFDSIIGCSEEI